jgi:methyl-accepting chemotaxis protein
MKINLPVTQQEIELREDSMIVSKTDLKGQITYINKDFVEISGFTEAELLGQSHNIVRHPDMPVEAFKDMWDALKDGRAWVGLVKNRCKNGDFYWVEAHAAPVFEGSQIVGYMSVRRKPARSAVTAADNAYRLFRDKQAKGLAIRDGRVVGTSTLAQLKLRATDMSVPAKMMIGAGLAAAVVLGGSTWFIGQELSRNLTAQGTANLEQGVKEVKALVEVQAKSLGRDVARLNENFAASFTEGFSVESGDLPTLKYGKTAMNGRTVEVDHFAASSHGVASLLVRKGEAFLPVTTSIKNDKGERAVEGAFSKDSPAYAKLLAGETFTGRVKLSGKDYAGAYRPIRSQGGDIIGAIFTGVDMSGELAALKQTVQSIKVGDSGYVYVLDTRPGKEQGTLVIHPSKEGASALADKDADGREVTKEMLSRKQGTLRYAETGGLLSQERLVAFDSYGDWQWMIASGASVDEIDAAARSARYMLWGSALVALLAVLVVISRLFEKLVRQPLASAILPAFRALSAGKYDSDLETTRRDEVGSVLLGLEAMQNRLGFEVAETKRQADEMTRVKFGLTNVTVPVAVSNEHNALIYMNDAAVELWQLMAPEIAKYVPGFRVDQMIGSDPANYFSDANDRQNFAADLHGTKQMDIVLGGRNLRVTLGPVRNEKGQNLGRVIQWLDRTAEILVEKEVESIVFAAAQGDFSKRLESAGKSGFFLSLSVGMNQLLETSARGLNDVASVLNFMAKGDLTHVMEGDYHGTFGQLKDDANATVARLKEVVGQIKDATQAINSAAQEIAAGNQDLSARTEEQASSLEETASSMEQLNATVRQNAENARQANELAKVSNEAVVRGGQVVKQVVSTMDEIQDSSRKIADIISVIDSIAFQTNILALNAAVEAARAGEQGRGFAVVATEVRNLAQRSATAAKEIKALIAESVDKVDDGAKLVSQAGSTMDEVVKSFQTVANLVTDIASASREQASGIEQVAEAVGQMDGVTQQNAALVEEAAAAAESLEEQARGLVSAVSMFHLGEEIRSPLKRPMPRLASHAPKAAAPKKLPLAHLDSTEDEWEEF